MEIDDRWIFETFLNLDTAIGESKKIVMHSVFCEEKTPSMIVFWSRKFQMYNFKDFSSGNGGTATELVRLIEGLSSGEEAWQKIIKVFKGEARTPREYVKKRKTISTKDEWTVSSYEIEERGWTLDFDVPFWTKHNISSQILDHLMIKPLKSYTLSCGQNKMTICAKHLYGYFNKSKELIKIYAPYGTPKFVKVKEELQNIDNLTNAENLLWLSSLKDIGACMSLGFKNIDYMCPDSENTMISIPPEKYNEITRERNSLIIFDNDKAGKNAAEASSVLFNTDYANLDLSKDIADSIKDCGAAVVKKELTKLLLPKFTNFL